MLFEDQLGRWVDISFPPKRIISLVPSQTEFLHSLGLNDSVVGITKFCVHPKEWHQSKKRVGGTKTPDFKTIQSLQPDLIIANKEENTKEAIEVLKKIAPVWISDVKNLQDAYAMMKTIGQFTNRSDCAIELISQIKTAFKSVKKSTKSVLYFIWKDPYYVAGKQTFIDSILTEAGYQNCCPLDRYPSLEEFDSVSPDVVFLSTEPYPFSQNHFNEFQHRFPKAKLILVDGEYFSWYGSRLVGTADYLNGLKS
jgi:iron complex transport system substrate-binding protein